MLTWWEPVAQVISLPWVTILLLVAGCLLLFHDLLTPLTWGITGTLGVLCIGLVLLAHAVSGLGVLILLAGVGLLLVETHFLPGQGMAALLGFALIFMGMFLALFQGAVQTSVGFSLGTAAAVTLLSVMTFFAYLPKSPIWKQFGRELQGASAGSAVHVGERGFVATTLRPVGVAVISGQQVTVVTEGEFLEPGAKIIVTEVHADRIVVDLINEPCLPIG